jgi:hypothetical protein
MKYSETYPTGKIVNFYYTDPKKRFVEVVWYNEEKDRSWISTFAKDGEMYNSFLEEFSEEELEKNSREEFKQRQQRLDARILEFIENNPKHVEHLLYDSILDNIVDLCLTGSDDEKIFKLKLVAFENDMIKENKDRAKKANLRKAKTFDEVLMSISKFTND